jgi:hypothetical protein
VVEAICPYGTFIHPRAIWNPHSLDAISYQWAILTFKCRLLQPALEGGPEQRHGSTNLAARRQWRFG